VLNKVKRINRDRCASLRRQHPMIGAFYRVAVRPTFDGSMNNSLQAVIVRSPEFIA